MRTALFILALLVTTPGLSSAAPPAPHSSPSAAPARARATAIAPADKYFGAFGMSPLSIRSTIGFLGRQYHNRTIDDHDLLHKAVEVEAALGAWRAAYPADPWLPPTYFHLEQLYQAVQTDEARQRATAMLRIVVQAYPSTKEAHMSRSRLAAGFPALVSESPVVAPSPDAAASPGVGTSDASAATNNSTQSQAMPNAAGSPAAAPLPATTGAPVMAASPSPK